MLSFFVVAYFLGLGLKQVSYVFVNLPNLAIYQLVCNCRLGPSFCVLVLNYWNLRNNGILLSVCKGRYLIRKHEKLSWLFILMLCSHLTSAFASTANVASIFALLLTQCYTLTMTQTASVNRPLPWLSPLPTDFLPLPLPFFAPSVDSTKGINGISLTKNSHSSHVLWVLCPK